MTQTLEAIKDKFYAEMVEYIRQHPEESYASVAEKFGISEGTVSVQARIAGIPRRQAGRRAKASA